VYQRGVNRLLEEYRSKNWACQGNLKGANGTGLGGEGTVGFSTNAFPRGKSNYRGKLMGVCKTTSGIGD